MSYNSLNYTQIGRTHHVRDTRGRDYGDSANTLTTTLGVVTTYVPPWTAERKLIASDRVTYKLLEELFDAGRVVTYISMCWRRVPQYEVRKRARGLGDVDVQFYPYVEGWVIECDDHEGHDEWFVERESNLITYESKAVIARAKDLFGTGCCML